MSKKRDHMARVAELGCMACRQIGYMDTPAELHHPRTGAGVGQRSSDFDVIPLCPIHHRTGGYGVAFHAGRRAFEAIYGTEAELLEKVRALL